MRNTCLGVCLGLASTFLASHGLTPAFGAEAQQPASEKSAVETSEDTEPLVLDRWLALGPVAVPWPAFHDSRRAGYGVEEVLDHPFLPPGELWPAADDRWSWPGRDSIRWQLLEAGGGGVELPLDGTRPQVAYLAVYLQAERFLKAQLHLEALHPVEVTLDGESVLRRAEAEGAAKPGDPQGTELVLRRGRHLLLVKAVADPGRDGPWSVSARLEAPAGSVTTGVDPRHSLRLTDLLDVDAVTGVDLSANGELVAVHLRHPAVPSEAQRQWTEIRQASDGSLVRTLATDGGTFAWAPEARAFAYTTSRTTDDGAEASLWFANLDDGVVVEVLKGLEGLSGFRISPEGTSIVYTVTDEAEPDERQVKRYRGLNDRWAGWRDRSTLWQVSLGDGVRRRLTAGAESTDLQDLSPDGARALFTVDRIDFDHRPFSANDLYELDLESLEATLLARVVWFGDARYSPEGERILVSASPGAFGDAGLADDLEGEGVANDYDTQLFLLERSQAKGAEEPRALTRDFDPAVLDATWSADDGSVVIRAQEGPRARIYRYDTAGGAFVPLETGLDVVAGMSVAAGGGKVAYWGSSAGAPERVLVRDLSAGDGPALVLQPNRERTQRLALGKVEEWSFTAEAEAAEITGRVYLPPDFDPSRRYPLIVYYYGGTVPTNRDFGGRYPKNYWAAQGYVVYVPQPSGATGFGQAFSARHVNDWGRRVSDEILQGVEAFLGEHPFVDRQRVGCTGASFGGFMTMLLLTRSQLCSAGVAHAGISSISSYWGQGWWGYLYSAVATADSYPWNRPDIYVDQSPLFAADQIQSPLLLLHGDADTNVPPGESQQLYTALQVLGREVELITFAGEDHRVVEIEKRRLWAESIVAWFDRYLKGEDAYWRHLWGDENAPKG